MNGFECATRAINAEAIWTEEHVLLTFFTDLSAISQQHSEIHDEGMWAVRVLNHVWIYSKIRTGTPVSYYCLKNTTVSKAGNKLTVGLGSVYISHIIHLLTLNTNYRRLGRILCPREDRTVVFAQFASRLVTFRINGSIKSWNASRRKKTFPAEAQRIRFYKTKT